MKISPFTFPYVKSLLLMVFTFSFTLNLYSQTDGELFTEALNRPNNLAADVLNRTLKMEADTTIEKLSYIRVGNLAKIQKNGEVTFKLPGISKMLVAKTREVKTDTNQDYEWSGIFDDDKLGFMTLFNRKGIIFGFIDYNNIKYKIWGLSEGNSVIVTNKHNLEPGTCGSEGITSHISSQLNWNLVQLLVVNQLVLGF